MYMTTPNLEPIPLVAEPQPWHRPALQRLEINTETRFGGESFDDGDGLETVTDLN
jgi:hypothetical protein